MHSKVNEHLTKLHSNSMMFLLSLNVFVSWRCSKQPLSPLGLAIRKSSLHKVNGFATCRWFATCNYQCRRTYLEHLAAHVRGETWPTKWCWVGYGWFGTVGWYRVIWAKLLSIESPFFRTNLHQLHSNYWSADLTYTGPLRDISPNFLVLYL